MALQHLTPEQVRDWPLEQKDRWWLDHVFRGDMPQLTLRSALTGFLLGGLLSATNLYVGAKTGWTLGVGLTSVILAFALYRAFSRFGARDMTILENNCVQSIATAAGYMTMPLTSGLAAYMWATNSVLPWWQILCFTIVLSTLGVLVAFPMKRRFINDEQHPFPEGRACGVVLDALYESTAAAAGMVKARALMFAAALAGGVSFVAGENYMKLVQQRWLGFGSSWHLPTQLDAWYYALVERGLAPLPKLAGVDIRQLALSPALDFAMIGAGGLMGIRAASSLLLGAVLNFAIVVPVMISLGEIQPRAGSIAAGTALFGRAHILNTWALWWGIVMMVVAALVALFARPDIFVEAFRSLVGRRKADTGRDVLRDIELPLPVSWYGVPVVGAAGVWMAHAWFGVDWMLGALAIPLILVLALIAASSTALTGITPSGSLSKIPQFTFGAIDPRTPAPNLMTAVMCSEVASNASNLLMDIKPGYMLGAKPRQQAIGHVIGIVAGALAATPLFYVLFGLADFDAAAGRTVSDTMVSDKFAFPAAVQWKGVSDLVTAIFGGEAARGLLTTSIVWSMVIAAFASLVMEVLRIRTRNRFPLSPLAIGLGVVVPPESSLMMFVGAAIFWIAARKYGDRKESRGYALLVDAQEPVCAGLIAGAALVGIGDILVKVFVLS
ncbi:MAG: family oligopeptide transporter [Burkholderiaceae bacterium]|jgi:OPT family oligopeptide transporter|nr:family oligopeptide transporter [Burkholderiaceae bacterium]